MADQNAPTPRATSNRSTVPVSDTFKQYISGEWAERAEAEPRPREQAEWAAARRARLSALYAGKRLIVPAGAAAVRSNDTDYAFRAHSAFSHLTGWASDTVAGSVLVLEPTSEGHTATLYFRKAAGRDSDEFYANSEIGEFWTGPRPSLAHVAMDLGLLTADLAEFDRLLDSVDDRTIILRDSDRDLTDQIDGRRLLSTNTENADTESADTEFARDLSELRLVKDPWEIQQMRHAVAATKKGFDDVIADRDAIVAHERGERLVEGTFNRRARAEGNAVGYDTIAASGPHACILHWTRNDGAVVPGDLILMDAGIELDSLYTADITRTLPVNGVFSETQRRVYEAVLEAADAAFAIVRP
ncbi:MAG: aminopeptidase P N-terminal domain-containing protein, partial [Microbacteriaceae bacterium]|nr:aminopeptidase P N-terminal domain-containing protein [Microbacteriaceae bacterium]